MIQRLDRATLIDLASYEGYPAVSLYMPTHRAGNDKQQDPLRMKNLLAEAERRLVDGGMRQVEAQAVLEEARALHADSSFWRDTGDGLAVFISPNGTMPLKLGTDMPEQVILGPWFYLRPLMPAWTMAHPFYLLALSQAQARLFRADRYGIVPLDLPESTPTSLDEELRFDVFEEHLQYKGERDKVVGRQPNGGAGTSVGVGVAFHGHGGEKDVRLSNLTRYLESLDKGVSKVLAGKNDPLVLAGVDYELDIYRQASHYAGLRADVRLSGNHDDATPERLHAQALEALQPLLDEPVERELRELREKSGGELVSADVSSIVPASTQGRVRALLLSDGVGPLGTVDLESWTVTETAPAEPRYLRESMDAMGGVSPDSCQWDLVDIAIAETLKHDGDVFAFTGEDPPVDGAAALYRY